MQRDTSFFLKLNRWSLIALAVLMPVAFLPFTLEPFEITKQTMLVVLSVLSFIGVLGSQLKQPSAQKLFPPSVLSVLAFVAVTAVAALGSSTPYRSWIGGSGIETESVLTWIGLFCAIVSFRFAWMDSPFRRAFRHAMVTGGAGAGTLAVVGILVPSSWVLSGVNSVGTANQLSLVAAVYGVFALAMLPFQTRHERFALWEAIMTWVTAISSLFILAAVDYGLALGFFAAGSLIVCIAVIADATRYPRYKLALVSFTSCLIASAFLFVFPGFLGVHPPLEATPSFSASKEVVSKILSHSSSLLGSGGGTFQFGFAKYHDPAMAKTGFWDTRIDHAYSFLFNIVASFGWLGLLCFLVAPVITLFQLVRRKILDPEQLPWVLGFVMSFVLFFVYPISLVLLGFFIFCLSALSVVGDQGVSLQENRRAASHPNKPAKRTWRIVVFVLGVFAGTWLVFFSGQRYASEIVYAQAIRSDRTHASILEVVERLDRARDLNRWNDLYVRNLSRSLLFLLNEKVGEYSDTEAMPEEVKTALKDTAALSVEAAKEATRLAPGNARNWLILGQVERELIPLLPEAASGALLAFAAAYEREPNSPAVAVEYGLAQTAIAAKEVAEGAKAGGDAAAATRKRDESLKRAEGLFDQAIILKPDYAPAHYQLGLVYQQQGRMDDAIGKMESVARYNEYDVGVYFQLGLLYLRRNADGDVNRAQQSLEHAVNLLPGYANARWFLATVYERQKEGAKAIEQVEKILEYNPEDQLAQARLARLKAGKLNENLPEILGKKTVGE
ncbi:tetratricopeptide repeat protein [Candidatus Uhrbacteria bacterium]|nr:tetratricopeptide repeat protein [Candidatus Uhrbacteria bacterium]